MYVEGNHLHSSLSVEVSNLQKTEFSLLTELVLPVKNLNVNMSSNRVSSCLVSNSWHLSVNTSVSRDIRARGMLEGVVVTQTN